MAHLAITIEGGLVSGDLVEQIAATPQEVTGQLPRDFRLEGRLSDEIQKAFSDGLIHWNAFNARIARSKESATTITRETWVLPLLEELGFTLAFQRAAAAAGRWHIYALAPARHRSGCASRAHRLMRAGTRSQG